MTSFKRFESKPVVKIIYIYTHFNLWRHRQFITIFYQFLHIRIEIIHGSHMYILFLPRVGLYVSFLPLANARGKTSWHKTLPVVKTIYTYGFHDLFLKQSNASRRITVSLGKPWNTYYLIYILFCNYRYYLTTRADLFMVENNMKHFKSPTINLFKIDKKWLKNNI